MVYYTNRLKKSLTTGCDRAMSERLRTVCFSGHRPEKMPDDPQLLAVTKSMLYYHIEDSIRAGYTRFISGLARGVDLWAAMYVLELKQRHSQLELICVKPRQDHGAAFRGEDLYVLDSVLERADSLICTECSDGENCYKRRNRYMVDHASKLIAVVNQYRSGTGQTIAYARKQGLELCVIDIRKVTGEAEKLGLLPVGYDSQLSL